MINNMLPKPSEADHQLERWATQCKAQTVLTTSNGAPVDTLTASLTVGANGPMLITDVTYLNHMAHFDRERVPERVVHAKGAGVYGEFEVTRDISQYTKAKIFSEVGKKTPMFVRFSQVSGESGSSDTARDPRGFAIKFYTEDGNWDLVANNTPIFFIRDPILFPSFIHTQKRNPVTHLKDANMFWDFLSLRPESVHQTMFLFSDRGTPDGYRHMHGFGGHAFKLVNDKGEAIYCKFHFFTNQGIKNLSAEQGIKLSGENPDYAIQDLYDAIARGDFPSWTFKIQLMTFEQAEKCSFDPFDITKVWPHGDYPLMEVGKFTLNKWPHNYFAEVEQVALSPANLVPGIEASPDKMLQGRIFSYPDTQRHRLGNNFEQLPINCPYRTKVANYQRDGFAAIYDDNQRGAPNYFPNSFNGPQPTERAKEHVYKVTGDVKRHETGDEDNFSQATQFWRKALDEEGRKNLVKNMAAHLKKASKDIQKRAVSNFTKVDESFGKQLQETLDKFAQEMKV